MKSNRILFIVQHRFNRSPGQRYRCEQYIPYLEKRGFQCTYSPLIINQQEDKALYQSTNIFDKGLIFIQGLARRMLDVYRAKNYGIIFIYREAFPTASIVFERMLKKSGAKIIFDFDDAIWLPTISEANKSFQRLKNPLKVNSIMAMSHLVIAGNNYLAGHALQFNKNVVVFPSTINLDYYQLKECKKDNGTVTIGWSGSHTTISHFESLVPVLRQLKNRYGDKLSICLYGDANYSNLALSLKGVAWSAETEVDVIASFDIGIMPLADDEWSKGKCAMKGLQYMGLAIPSVLSAVGMNKEVIKNGENGYLAENDKDWLQYLEMLIDDAELRRRIGAAGRKTVEELYSCQAKNEEYVKFFLALSDN